MTIQTIQLIQERLPARYRELSLDEAAAAIREAKAALGSDVLILCHHYQRHEIFEHADRTGDSFKLAREAAEQADARWVVFCGVHFMAESADILTGPEQIVILPDLTAGCSMADMADELDVEQCWEDLGEIVGPEVVPITYMNSSAALKAFCGDAGGAVCTSSNAAAVLRWAWERKPRILFFPDEHLGRNTAVQLGVPDEEMAVWDYTLPLGGLAVEEIRRARILLWRGHCSVHMKFDPEHVRRARELHPEIRVIVHPECRREVVDLADDVGSTEHILRTVRESPKGAQWAVGTELHLVDRLAREMKPEGKLVASLNPSACLCSTMYRVDAPHLLWVLESLREGRVVNRVRVEESVARSARVALDRMLSIT
jgi:quinolinate synthase